MNIYWIYKIRLFRFFNTPRVLKPGRLSLGTLSKSCVLSLGDTFFQNISFQISIVVKSVIYGSLF